MVVIPTALLEVILVLAFDLVRGAECGTGPKFFWGPGRCSIGPMCGSQSTGRVYWAGQGEAAAARLGGRVYRGEWTRWAAGRIALASDTRSSAGPRPQWRDGSTPPRAPAHTLHGNLALLKGQTRRVAAVWRKRAAIGLQPWNQ